MAEIIITKRQITGDDLDIDASDLPFAAQSTKTVEDLVDGGKDVDIYVKELEATTATLGATSTAALTATSVTASATLAGVSAAISGNAVVGGSVTAASATISSIAAQLLRLPSEEATISGDILAITRNMVRVRGENLAADDLKNITGGSDGQILILRSGREAIKVKHALGNIVIGADYTLDTVYKVLVLVFDGTINRWLGLSTKDNG